MYHAYVRESCTRRSCLIERNTPKALWHDAYRIARFAQKETGNTITFWIIRDSDYEYIGKRLYIDSNGIDYMDC